MLPQAASHQYPNHHHAGLGVTDEAFANSGHPHHGPPHPHQQHPGRRAHLLPLDPRGQRGQPDAAPHQHPPGRQDEQAASVLALGDRGAHASASATRLPHGQHAHSHRHHQTLALLYDRAAPVAAGGAGVAGERGNADEGAGGAAGAMGGGPQPAASHHAGVPPSLAHAQLRSEAQQQRLHQAHSPLPDLLLLRDRGSPAPQPAQLQVGPVGMNV